MCIYLYLYLCIYLFFCSCCSEYLHVTTALGTGLNKNMEPYATHRVILHFDLDCFYAQVEMIRNPALREVPLGKYKQLPPVFFFFFFF